MSAANNVSRMDEAAARDGLLRGGVQRTSLPQGKFPGRVSWALAQLSSPLAEEVGVALSAPSKRSDVRAPSERADDTQQMTAIAVLDAFRALGDYGVVPNSIADMVTVAALDILRQRVDDVIWEEVNLCRVLVSLRYLYRYIYARDAPGYLKHRITYLIGAARRNQWANLRTPAECIAAAVAAAGLADVISAAGQEYLGQTRLRDAAILAVGAEVNFRIQEFSYIDIASIRIRTIGGIEEAAMFMAKRFCKNRKGRIGIVRNPAALNLLRRLIGERTSGPLFLSRDGSWMGKAGIAQALRRVSLTTLGVPLSANLLRRAGVSDEDDPAEKARRIGDSHGGQRTGIAERYYDKCLAVEGLDLLREP